MAQDDLPPPVPGEKHQDYVRRVTGAVLASGARNETIDDVRPLGLGGRIDWVAAAKVAGKVVAILAAAIIPAVTAGTTAFYRARDEARVRSQSVKNKSEAGYQVSRQALEALEARVLLLEEREHRQQASAATAAAALAPKPPKKGGKGAHRAAPAAPPPALAAAPPTLPGNLDQAEKQVYKATAAATAAASAAPTPRPAGIDSAPP